MDSNHEGRKLSPPIKAIFAAGIVVIAGVAAYFALIQLGCLQNASGSNGIYSTNCSVGVTLGLTAKPSIPVGTNQTFQISLKNDRFWPNGASYSGPPSLPHGLSPLDPRSVVYFLPVGPGCGYAAGQVVPYFIAIYNESGYPLQLNVVSPDLVTCVVAVATTVSYQFAPSQTLTETVSLGGAWRSSDVSEPWLNATYSQFKPGTYTVVSFDPWKQLVELNFTVNG